MRRKPKNKEALKKRMDDMGVRLSKGWEAEVDDFWDT